MLLELRTVVKQDARLEAQQKQLESQTKRLEADKHLAGAGLAPLPDVNKLEALKAQLQQVKQVRASLLAQYPASGLVKTEETELSDAELQGVLLERFNSVQQNIESSREKINNEDVPIEQLEPVIDEVLAEQGENLSTEERQEIEGYIAQQRRIDKTIKYGGTAAEVALTVGAVISNIYSFGITGLLAGFGAAIGLGTAAYELEQAGDLNTLAKAGVGGGDPLIANPDAAQLNRNLAIANLVLAGVDVLAVGVDGAKLANKVLSGSKADVIAKLTPEQTKQFKTLAITTDEAQKQQLRQSLKQELGDEFDAAYKVFDSSEFRELTDAETRLITGGGQVTDSPFAGMDYNNLTPQEKAILEQNYTVYNTDARRQAGKPDIIRLRDSKSGNPPIHIEEVNGQYIIKNGHAKSGSNRISDAKAMKDNYRAVHGDIPDGHQLHHIIPDNVVQRNPLAKEAYKRGYDLDRASNLEALPSYGKPEELVHRGPHKEWDNYVSEVLNNQEEDLLEAYSVDSVDKLPARALENALKSAERKLQKDLVNTQLGLQKGWLKREPTGLKLSENEDVDDAKTA